MTYLVVRLETLGNVAMTVPVIATLSVHYQEHQFVVVAKKALADMFFGMSNVQFYQVEKQMERHPILLADQLYRSYHPDAIIDLQRSLLSGLMNLRFRTYHLPIYRIDNGLLHKRLLCAFPKKNKKLLPSQFERYTRTFALANLKTKYQFGTLPVNREARSSVMERFAHLPQPWIGVAPFAKYKSNVLPYKCTKEVIRQLVEKGYHVFLFGAGQVECEILNQWADTFQQVTSVAGCLTLSEELELMRKLRAMICMDSANQHLCSLVGLRAVSIWCGTHPNLGFSGLRQSTDDMIQIHSLRCRPCTIHGTNRCKFHNFACKNITPATILARLENQ